MDFPNFDSFGGYSLKSEAEMARELAETLAEGYRLYVITYGNGTQEDCWLLPEKAADAAYLDDVFGQPADGRPAVTATLKEHT